MFSKPSYFCMWNFVSADKAMDKAHFPFSAETKSHIQKCNTCRDIENLSRGIRFHNGTVLRVLYDTSTVEVPGRRISTLPASSPLTTVHQQHQDARTNSRAAGCGTTSGTRSAAARGSCSCCCWQPRGYQQLGRSCRSTVAGLPSRPVYGRLRQRAHSQQW